MYIFVASILFILSIVAVIFLSKSKFRFKVPLIALCLIIIVISAFLDAVWIYFDRIERGAELFLLDAISSLNNGILPPLSTDMPDDEKMQIESLKNNLPKENYTLEYKDFWVRMFEYYIHYEGGKLFLCSVEAPNMGLLFGKTSYRLSYFIQIEENQSPKSE